MGGLRLWGYVHNPITWIDPLGLDVKSGKGRVHVKYTGYKNVNGQILPYHGYASMPYIKGQAIPSADEIIANRYNNNFSEFTGGQAPQYDYVGLDEAGKQTAGGLEQKGFENDGKLEGTANKQNPVGVNNKNKDVYEQAANKHENQNKINETDNSKTGGGKC